MSEKKQFIPKPTIVTKKLATSLYPLLKNDLNKGYFDLYPEVKSIMYGIMITCKRVILSDILFEIPLTNIETIHLKANDYIKDNKFHLPNWYCNQ